MRVSVQLLATATVAAVFLAANLAVADLQLDNLVGHWKLDSNSGNTAVDSINGNNGAWQNGEQVNLTWPVGFLGNAASLVDAGGDNFFRIPSITQLEGGAGWTISTWINPGSNSGYTGVFMSRTTNGGGSWGLAIEPGGDAWHTDNRWNNAQIDSPNDIVPDGSWYHVAYTWDGTTGNRNAYINGAPVADSEGDAIGSITASGTWDIGYDDCCGGGRDFDGLIDDLALWNVALADADILEVYTNGLDGKDAAGNAAPLPPVPGDVDGNQIVNDNDFEIIRGSFFESVLTREEGDLSGDGFVDFDDFNEWKVAANAPEPSGVAIPEPGCLALVVLAVACVRSRRRAASC